MTNYQVTKNITYTLIVSAQTPADAAIIAECYDLLDDWESSLERIAVIPLDPNLRK